MIKKETIYAIYAPCLDSDVTKPTVKDSWDSKENVKHWLNI